MDVREELSSLGVNPSGSQHFLKDEVAVRKFLSEAKTSGKKVLEIGPGTGSITKHINADELFLVENDPSLAQKLKQENLSVENQVIEEDFLNIDMPEEVDLVVGNIPFHLSSDILDRLSKIQIRSVVIVQEEMADKAVAAPGDANYNFFSFKMSYFFVPVKASTISSTSYYPEPEVDTAVLKLYPGRDRYSIGGEAEFLDFVKALFTHKKKKLRNALVDARNILGEDKDVLKNIRDNLPHSETRVFDLDVNKMQEVFQEYRENLG